MRKFLISAALATAAITAAPAAAQYQGGPGWSQPNRNAERQIARDLDQIDRRIAHAEQRRQLHPRTAMQLRRELNQTRQLFHRYARNGLSQRQFFELRQRIDRLEQRVRFEIRDDRRDNRRGW